MNLIYLLDEHDTTGPDQLLVNPKIVLYNQKIYNI